MDLGLHGKRVLVTGASRGIGRALARGFAAEGAQVSVVARTEAALRELVDEMGGESGGHSCMATDLTATGAPTEVARAVVARSGGVDIVVHNLGGSGGVRDTLAPVEDWIRTWRLNVGVAIEINNILAPQMVARGWGRIVTISSRSAVEFRGAGPYAAAKAHLNAYTTILGRELAKSGVLVTGIMSGAVAADGNAWDRAQQSKPDEVASFLKEHQAIGRLGRADDLVPFVLLLASAQNRFAAGSLFSVDGGSM